MHFGDLAASWEEEERRQELVDQVHQLEDETKELREQVKELAEKVNVISFQLEDEAKELKEQVNELKEQRKVLRAVCSTSFKLQDEVQELKEQGKLESVKVTELQDEVKKLILDLAKRQEEDQKWREDIRTIAAGVEAIASRVKVTTFPW